MVIRATTQAIISPMDAMILRTDFPTTGIHVDDHKLIHRALNSTGYVIGLQPGLDGATNNVGVLSEAITNAKKGVYGQQVIVPPGDWYLNDTVLMSNTWGMTFQGTGLATRFNWTGLDDRPMFRLSHCRQCRMRDFLILANTPLWAGVQIAKIPISGETVTPTQNHCENLYLQGNGGALAHGFYIGGGLNENNDFNMFSNCEVTRYSKNGWTIDGNQSYNNMMLNCKATSSLGEYGVLAGENGDQCGTFSWIGGGMSGNTKADFLLGHSIQPFKIDGGNFEKSARFLEIRGALVQAEISNCRWSARYGLAADNQVIVAEPWYLQLAVRNCNIGDGMDDPMPPLGININPSRGLSGFTFTNNFVWSTAESLWTNQQPTQASGNMQILDHSLNMQTI